MQKQPQTNAERSSKHYHKLKVKQAKELAGLHTPHMMTDGELEASVVRSGKIGKGRSGKSSRCGSCVACSAGHNCGTCENCRDMRRYGPAALMGVAVAHHPGSTPSILRFRFGGPGLRKKACIARICRNAAVLRGGDAHDDALVEEYITYNEVVTWINELAH